MFTFKQNFQVYKIKSNKTKISFNSYKIALKKFTNQVSKIAKKYGTEEINFIEYGQVLTEVGLFRAIFPSEKEEAVFSKPKVSRNFRTVKAALVNAKQKEKRRQEEIDFYEHSWMILNPGNLEIIDVNHCIDLLKVLFCPTVNDQNVVVKLIDEYLGSRIALKKNELRKSPITDKVIPIWSLKKLVTSFNNLKENELAYKKIKNFNSKLEMQREEHKKVFTFEPNLNKHRSKSTYNFLKERVPQLISHFNHKKELKDQLKKEKDEEELKTCTFVPKITKHRNLKNDSDKTIVFK